jgi:hypothetical protein
MAGHFEREARFMALFAILFGVGLLGAFVAPKVIQFVRVDRCLDRGGRYEYATGRCEFAPGER